MPSSHPPADTPPFRYGPHHLDLDTGTLECHYEAGEHHFVERVALTAGGADARPDPASARAAARLVHLLAGVSYFKALPSSVVDLGEEPTSPLERSFLLSFYRDGLAEFAYRNGLDLSRLRLVGPERQDGPSLSAAGAGGTPAAGAAASERRPLVPFGGGIDSIVTAEHVRSRAPETSLLVVERPGEPFAALDTAASVSGLPVLRAQRTIDPQLLRGTELGFLQGHVPVTGILSAIALLGAVLTGRDSVVMSNERSASAPNLVLGDHPVNHQWSKGLAFEEGFRQVLGQSLPGGPEYFSLLRPYSELWVARRFAELTQYHRVFRSCNRSFHQDRAARLDTWCGRCDKCCFVDLVLAPFLSPETLAAVFGGHEPLEDPDLTERFLVLVGRGEAAKPFECVGDVEECAAAAAAAAGRPDRVDQPILQALATAVGGPTPGVPAELLEARGRHFVPAAYVPDPLLV